MTMNYMAFKGKPQSMDLRNLLTFLSDDYFRIITKSLNIFLL